MFGYPWAKRKEAWAERINLMMPYQVNMDMIKADRQPTCEIHALLTGFPRRRHTTVGKQLAAEYPQLKDGGRSDG